MLTNGFSATAAAAAVATGMVMLLVLWLGTQRDILRHGEQEMQVPLEISLIT